MKEQEKAQPDPIFETAQNEERTSPSNSILDGFFALIVLAAVMGGTTYFIVKLAQAIVYSTPAYSFPNSEWAITTTLNLIL